MPANSRWDLIRAFKGYECVELLPLLLHTPFRRST